MVMRIISATDFFSASRFDVPGAYTGCLLMMVVSFFLEKAMVNDNTRISCNKTDFIPTLKKGTKYILVFLI
jgi:hypothetical protein